MEYGLSQEAQGRNPKPKYLYIEEDWMVKMTQEMDCCEENER